MKYIDWLDDWLNNYVKPSVKVRTYDRYALILKLHLVEKLGKYELKQLTPMVLQKHISELLSNGNLKTGGGLSANSVNSIISVVQNSLRRAYILGLVSTYTADKIKRPRLSEKSVDCFSCTEQKIIENFVLCSKKEKLLGIVLCLYMGLRIGELLALTWHDIDFAKGIRLIPLPKQLLPLLKGCTNLLNP